MMDRSIFPGTGEFCNLIVCPEKFCNLIRDAVLSKLWHVSSVVSSASGGVGHYTYLLTYQGTHGKAFQLPFRLTFTYDQMLGWVKAFQDLGFGFNLRRPFRELHTDAFQGTHTKDIFVFQVARADCQKICTKTGLQMASILIYLAAIFKTVLPIFVFAV